MRLFPIRGGGRGEAWVGGGEGTTSRTVAWHLPSPHLGCKPHFPATEGSASCRLGHLNSHPLHRSPQEAPGSRVCVPLWTEPPAREDPACGHGSRCTLTSPTAAVASCSPLCPQHMEPPRPSQLARHAQLTSCTCREARLQGAGQATLPTSLQMTGLCSEVHVLGRIEARSQGTAPPAAGRSRVSGTSLG